jgi:hypothetical protein
MVHAKSPFYLNEHTLRVNYDMQNRVEKNNYCHQNNKNASIDAHNIGFPGFQVVFQNEKTGNSCYQRENA